MQALALLLLFCVGLAGFAVWQLGEIRAQVDGHDADSQRTRFAQARSLLNLQAIRRAILRYAFDHDEKSFVEAETRLKKSASFCDAVMKMTASEERRAAYKEIDKDVEELKAKRLALGEAVNQIGCRSRRCCSPTATRWRRTSRNSSTPRTKTDLRSVQAGALEAKVLLVRVANWRTLATRDAKGITTFRTNVEKAQAEIAELEKAALPANLAALLGPSRRASPNIPRL